MKFRVLLLLALLPAFSFGADPPKPIRLPEINIPDPPKPVPKPSPNSAIPLPADRLYVIDSDVACLVLASPSSALTITKDAGPIKIRGSFVDGAGKSETRTYKGKEVYTVEVADGGRVELIIVPVGADSPDKVTRQLIDAGTAPLPPPAPDPKPDPKPDPAVETADHLMLAVVEDVTARTPAIAKVLNATSWWRGLEGKGHHYAFYDVNTSDPVGKSFAKFAVGTLPQLVICDFTTGKVLASGKSMPLPASTAELDALVSKYSKGAK